MEKPYDIVIIGGGLVGASLACALRALPLRIALLDAAPMAVSGQRRPDDRVIALAEVSRRIFEGLGLWSAVAAEAAPIREIHVSNRGHFGFARLRHSDIGREALGYVVYASRLTGLLHQSLSTQDNLTVYAPAQLRGVDRQSEQVVLHYEQAGQMGILSGKLLVAADGGQSGVREQMGVSVQHHDYGQTAIITTITLSQPHRHTAYERFTPGGPLAILPLPGRACSVVWTVATAQAAPLRALEDTAFLQALQDAFGWRLGRFVAAGPRGAYPLALLRVSEQVQARLALIGNAAHVLHPVAGQGLNLGLRDVAALAEVLARALAHGQAPGNLDVLRDYARQRAADQQQTAWMTDSLVKLFSNDSPPLSLARNLGLLALDACPPLKNAFARRAAGGGGVRFRLLRGLPVTLSGRA